MPSVPAAPLASAPDDADVTQRDSASDDSAGESGADAADTDSDTDPEAEPEGPDAARPSMAAPEPQEPPEPQAPQPAPAPPKPAVATGDAPLVVIKTLLGLLALVVLAYLGGHPKVRWIEARLGISRVVAAGFPFLVLGLVAASEPVGVLSPTTIEHMRPVLHLALGWVGLAAGMKVEFGRLGSLPRGTPVVLGIGTGLPFVMITAAGGVLLLLDRASRGEVLLDAVLLRDALVLGTAGAMTADTEALRVAMRKATDLARDHLSMVASLDETVGLVGLIFLTACFRPAASWQVPGSAWLFITLGLSACLGFVVYFALRLRTSSTELVVLLLGSVAFVAGIASTLLLSALVVCFVVGVLLSNFPGDYHARLRGVLGRLEAPIYLFFLLVAGARWQPAELLGWALVIVLVITRLPGRWLGARLAWRHTDVDLPAAARPALVLSPLGTLPIAIAVNAELLYPGDDTLPAIVTAVIGATIVLEVFAQLYWRPSDARLPGGS